MNCVVQQVAMTRVTLPSTTLSLMMCGANWQIFYLPIQSLYLFILIALLLSQTAESWGTYPNSNFTPSTEHVVWCSNETYTTDSITIHHQKHSFRGMVGDKHGSEWERYGRTLKHSNPPSPPFMLRCWWYHSNCPCSNSISPQFHISEEERLWQKASSLSGQARQSAVVMVI